MKRLEEFADSVVKATQAYVARHFGPLAERIKAVEDWRASVPAARDGAPGKDADPELVRLMVTEAVSKIPPAKNGEDGAPGEIGENGAPGVDGKDADVDAIAQMVITKVTGVFDLIPLPKNGADGKDGKDADVSTVRSLVDEVVAERDPEFQNFVKELTSRFERVD
jgi:hypothetical protein